MADVISIDAARVRAAARVLRASAESLDGSAVAGCEFGASGAGDPVRERAIREGYLRLARAIGAWRAASATTGRAVLTVVDAYDGQDDASARGIASGTR